MTVQIAVIAQVVWRIRQHASAFDGIEAAMQAAKYVLLILDLLNDCFRQQAPLAAQRDQLVASVNRLTAAFRQARQPVVWEPGAAADSAWVYEPHELALL